MNCRPSSRRRAAQRRLGGRDQRLTGLIRIATLDDLVQTVLAPVISGFTQLHPAVCLELIIDTAFTDLERRPAGLWILIHPDLRRNARVRAFVDYASEHLGAARDRLAGLA